MKLMRNLFLSSLGKKYIMAATGCVLFLFVLGHLAGNLQIFLGSAAINRYGNFLQSNPELIWPARVVLLAMVLLHIWSASKLSLENRAARPVAYAQYQPVGSTYASRTMLMSGTIIFVFIVYHLLDFTFQVKAVNGTGQDFRQFAEQPAAVMVFAPSAGHGAEGAAGRHDIFKMMVTGFRVPWVSGFYILGMGLLCLHLSHGASSMFQSMGWKNEAYRPLLDNLARVVARLVFLGYVSIPVAILLGYGKEAMK